MSDGVCSVWENQLTEFCKHLRLQQWELAQCYARTLVKICPSNACRTRVLNLLRSFAVNVSPLSPGFLHKPSSRFTWLCSRLLSEIAEEDSFLEDEAEFRNAICDVLPDAPVHVLNELSNVFFTANEDSSSEKTKLSDEFVDMLRSHFREEPRAVDGLLVHLVRIASKSSNDAVLAQLYSVYWRSIDESYRKGEDLSMMVTLLPDSALCDPHAREVLDRVIGQDAMGTLLGRESPLLLQQYFEDEELADESWLESILDEEVNFGELFLHTLRKGKHFLESLLSIAANQVLVKGEIPNAFNHSWMKKLSPLVIFAALQSYKTDIEFYNVMNAITHQLDESGHPIADKLVKKLKRNHFLAKWCTEHSRGIPRDIEKYVFESLQTQSPLRVLNKYIGLRNIEPFDMLKLLQESADITKGDTSRHDITIYRGYLAVNYAMEAVNASAKLEMISAELDSSFPFERDKAMAASLLKDGFRITYSRFVGKKLESMRNELVQILPVMYRIEVLENIFSLLFVTRSDLNDTLSDDSDEGYIGDEPRTEPSSCDPEADEEPPRRKVSVTKSSSTPPDGSTSSSSCAVAKEGFLCNEMVVGDLISLLKDAVIDAMPLVYGAVSSKSNETPGSSITCSINLENIQKRFNTLSKQINEAHWRLMLLVSGDELEASTSKTIDPSGRRFDSKERPINPEGSRKDRKRRKRRKTFRPNVADGNFGGGIIPRMLSSPDSLLRFSILQRKLKQAAEVIQLFSLQKSSDALELRFCMKLPDILKSLNSGTISKMSPSSTTFGKDMTAVAQAASEGLRTTTEMLGIEKILSSDLLPKIIELELLDPEVASSLEFTDPQSVLLADLAYTSCSVLDRTLFILEKAAQKLRKCTAEDITTKASATKGIVSVLGKMIKFLQEIPNATSNCPPYIYETSMSKLLVNQLAPLDAQNIKDCSSFWDAFFRQFATVTSLLVDDEQTTVVLSGDEKQNTPERLHLAFLELSKLCLKNFDHQVTRKRIDYLGALYDRVKRVSHVLAESRNKPGPPTHQSYFSVLQHSHVGILGTLVLQRKLSNAEFQRLEEFAQQLQLDLVNVILETCCPSIPVSREISFFCENTASTVARDGARNHPELVARQILSSLIEILKGDNFKLHSEGLLTVEGAFQLSLQPQMQAWLESCSQLSTVDLQLLSSHEEKLAFFANAANIAWMWVVFSNFQNATLTSEKSKWLKYYSCDKLLSPYLVERFIYQKMTCFSIGQIGLISLFDLKHRLTVGHGPLPNHYIFSPSKISDSARDYFPSVEPRILFVLNESFLSSPRLQVLHPDKVSEQLNDAMTEYLTNHVEVDIIHEIVRMPEILKWYRQSFVTDDPNAPYEGLVNFAADIIGGDLKKALQSLQALDGGSLKESGHELPFQLEFVPSTTFGIVLDYSCLLSSLDGLSKKMSVSMPPDHAVAYINLRCSPLADILNLIGSNFEGSEDTPLKRQLNRWKNHVTPDNSCSDLIGSALSPTSSGPYLWEQVQRYIDKENFEKALMLARETCDPGASVLREFILTRLCMRKPSTDCPEPWSYALQIRDPCLRYETLSEGLFFWSEDECLMALGACLALSAKHDKICRSVKMKVKEMQVYKKTLKVLKMGPSTISRWQNLKEIPPERIMVELRTMGKIDLLLEWAQLHRDGKVDVESSQLKQKMNRLVGDADGQQDSDSEQIQLGMQILADIKERNKWLYQELVETPMILLEQLLMNSEIATAGRAIMAVKDNITSKEVNNIDKLIEQYAEKAVEFSIGEVLTDSLELTSMKSLIMEDYFTMPAKVPTKEEWVPDFSVTTCMACLEERFSMFSRRHHCRRCGRVVCASCSQRSLAVVGYGKDPVRVCRDCFEQSTFTQLGTSSDKIQSVGSTASFIRNRADSFRATPFTLTIDDTENKLIREEFAYDQAPSVSLCLSILKHHSDPRQCGDFMLALCDDMFAKLVPRDLGRPNPEVDYALVISMMRSLLLNAKVKFVEADHKVGVQYTDKYLSHLDLTNMLVGGNCTHLIPKEDITGDDTFRRIRDSLLEEERFTLALEVSTKCGLELHSLWAAWGMICLRAGEWAAAREKFSRCLQKLKNSNQQESPLLKDIINCLEDFRSSAATKGSENIVQKTVEECHHYLHRYGSHSSIVSFYQLHGMFTEALRHLLDKVSDSEIFVVSLFMPSVQSGRLGVVLQQIRVLDPTLAKTWRFLMTTCLHLQHKKLYSVLYRVQLFMEDYIRAAMTSIHFFRAPASRCSELFERLSHLESARKNFESYLKQDSDGRETLKLSSEEVKRHLQTLTLQIKVTNYLYVCESKDMDIQIGDVTQRLLTTADRVPRSLPTLFDSSPQKTTLAILLLVYGSFEEGGMDLALKVISNYNLDGTKICSLAAQELVNAGGINELIQLVAFVRIRPASYSLDMDKVIGASVALLANQPEKSKEVETLIRQMSSDVSKINAYVKCGKLKSAYLLAIRLGRVSDVELIRDAATSTGQENVKDICEKWLKHKQET